MKKSTVKLSVLSAAMICAAGMSGVGSAHDAPGSLAADASAIDVYHTSCFTWNAAAAAALVPPEAATAAKRFVGQIHKQCTTNNAACNAAAGTVRLTLGSPFGQTPVAGATTTTATTNAGAADPNTGLWLSGAGSTWAQVADTAGADRNGTYTFAVSHNSAVVNTYQATIHCENATYGTAAPGTTAQHTGTGVGPGNSDVANGATTTSADFNQFTDQ